MQLYAPNGNGQVVFIGNVSLNGNSTKSIAGDSVTIRNGVLVTVTGPKASVYVNSLNNVPKANYSGFGGNGTATGTFRRLGRERTAASLQRAVPWPESRRLKSR